MNRKQKLILILFAVADVIVIGLLGTVVVAQTRRARMAAVPISTVSPCAAYLLESLARETGSPRISQPADGLLVQVTFDRVANPAKANPQMLWTLLDGLSPEFEQRCGTPARVTLSADFPNLPAPQRFTVSVPGPSLVAWIRGTLTDDELAEVAAYRSAWATTP